MDGFSTEQSEQHATLHDVLIWLTRHWWRLILVAVLCGAATFFVVRQMPFEYTAVVTVVPAGATQGGGNQPGSLGGLASLAGLQTGAQSEKTKIALALLQSRNMIDSYVEAQGIAPLLLSPEIGDGPMTPAKRELVFKKFVKMVEVKQAQDSGVTAIRVTWRDPAQAAAWANGLVAKVNAEMQRRALLDTGERKAYLEQEMGRTLNAQLRISITDLIASQLRTAMMAKQPSGFAFEIVDPAIAPTRPSGPRIVLLSAAGCVLGFLLGIIWGLLANVKRP